MEYLSWDLAILSRAVAYPNLSIASSHVGLSQPQLSRIVSKLEEDFGVSLLDRESRRRSSWTPAALRLAEIYNLTFQDFRAQVLDLAKGLEPKHIRVGTLEGLIPLTVAFCNILLAESKALVVELDVLDTNMIEEKFSKGELDLVFSLREPAQRKFRHSKVLGYQSIDIKETGPLKVFSTFEFLSESQKQSPREKCFVSNSLRARKEWLERFGGTGTVPSQIHPNKSGKTNEVPVILVANDILPQALWEHCLDLLSRI